MPDPIVIIGIVVVVALALSPAVRRWLRTGGERPLVDLSQDIRTESIDGLPGWNHYAFRNRIRPRGRRHAAPPDAVIHRRDKDATKRFDGLGD
jgi:hypothetical protein